MVICTRSHHARLTTTGQTERECHFFSIKIIIALKFSFTVFVYTRKYRFWQNKMHENAASLDQFCRCENAGVIENSFVAEKYAVGIIMRDSIRRKSSKCGERGWRVTSVCTFSNKVWSGHVAEPSGELCLCGWNNKGGIPVAQERVNTLLSSLPKITLVSFAPSLSFSFLFLSFRKSRREYASMGKTTTRSVRITPRDISSYARASMHARHSVLDGSAVCGWIKPYSLFTQRFY